MREREESSSALLLELHNNSEELQRMAAQLRLFADGNALAPELAQRLLLICEELVSNIIKYGYQAGQSGAISLHVGTDGRTLSVEIIDAGQPYNPLCQPDPDLGLPLEERSVGGLGIYLAKQYADSMEYRRQDGRNRLKLALLRR